MKKAILILVLGLLYGTSISSVQSFENNKKEIGFYFGTKIYKERHPVDNSFFMSQDGWMLGYNTNSETYDSEIYFGFKNKLAAGSNFK